MTPTTIVLTNARRDHKNLFATKDEPVKAHLLRNVWPELILNALIRHRIRRTQPRGACSLMVPQNKKTVTPRVGFRCCAYSRRWTWQEFFRMLTGHAMIWPQRDASNNCAKAGVCNIADCQERGLV
jgi:hypothetical protein